MNRVALKVLYEGRAFHGSQIQPHERTVEGEIVKALQKTGYIKSKKNSKLQMASRTDAGVTAFGNVCAFTTAKTVNVDRVNASLPKDIRFIGLANVPLNFNPRHADQRHYKYITYYDAHDLNAIRSAASKMKGTHSFHNFSKTSTRNPEVTIRNIKIKKKNHCLVFDVCAEHFLWQQVRRMISYLLKIGKNETVPSLKTLFNTKTKNPTAPADPQGLVLLKIEYKNVKFTPASKAVQDVKDCFMKKTREKLVEDAIRAEF